MNPALACQRDRPSAARTRRSRVVCASDASQTYALYLPSTYYRRSHVEPAASAFHPGARGRAMVETYRAAAERYGYIVAGLEQRRGTARATVSAARRAAPCASDVGQRFAIDRASAST